MLVFSASVLAAQTIGSNDPRTIEARSPVWMQVWSPLAPIMDIPRELPRAVALPMLLTAPAPRVGQFWTAGTPAELRAEASDSYATAAGQLGRESGSFHRPLDPETVETRQLHAIGWRQIRDNGAAIGSIVVANELMDPASYADASAPYGSAPMVVTDTSLPDMRRVRARLEGAVGYRLGSWGLGVGLGVEAQDYRTDNARFPRISRSAIPGVVLGISRTVSGLRLGVHGRWVGGAETLTLNPIPAFGQAHLLFGFTEPDPISVAMVPGLYRRSERDATAIGVSLSGSLSGVTWVLVAQRERRTESQSSQRLSSGEDDSWTAEGFAGTAALQARPLSRVLVTAWVGGRTLEGSATRIGLTGDVFRARENRVRGMVDVRYATVDSAWQLGVVGAIGRDYRLREDFVALLYSEVTAWSPGVSVELARRLDARTAVSIGVARSFAAASSIVPDATNLGPVYRQLIAPEHALGAAETQPMTVGLALTRDVTSGATVWVRGWRESVSPNGTVGLPFFPDGDRSTWSVAVGVRLR